MSRFGLIPAIFGAVMLASSLAAQTFAFNRIIQTGDVIPNGNSFTALSPYGTGSDGRVFFGGADSNPSTAAWFSSSGGTTQLLVNYSTVAPGGSNPFTDIVPVSVDGNNFYFRGWDGSTTGLYYHDGTSLQALLTTGSAAPGGSFGSFFSSMPFASNGKVAFVGSVNGSNNGLFLAQGGSVSRLFGNGDTVTGHAAALTGFGPGGYFYVGNDNGNIATVATSSAGNLLVGYSTGGGAVKLADSTTTAPGIGGTFTDYSAQGPSVDGTIVYFMGQSANGSGIFSVDVTGGAVTMLADTNTAAPGAGGNFTSFSGYTAADAGRVVFYGSYTGGSGIFVYEDGVISRILGTGDTLDARTVTGLSFNVDSLTGDELLINAAFGAGQVAIFETSLAAIPEPGTWAVTIGTLALGVVLVRRRKDGPR